MDTFRETILFAPIHSGFGQVEARLRGFDPVAGSALLSGRLTLTVHAGPADLQWYPTPTEARELAAALLTAADTFDDGPSAGAYLVKYTPRVPPYPQGASSLRVAAVPLRVGLLDKAPPPRDFTDSHFDAVRAGVLA